MNSKKRANSAFCQIDWRKYPQCMRSLVVTRFLAVLMVLALVPFMGSAQVSASSADALANARELFRKADFQGAAAAFQKIIETQPSSEAYSGLVRSLLK